MIVLVELFENNEQLQKRIDENDEKEKKLKRKKQQKFHLSPALAILTAHSSTDTPSKSPAEQILRHMATGLPVAFITSIAHSASSTYINS